MLPPNVLELIGTGSTRTRIAVVGASNNPEKYGNTIVVTLVEHGFTVLPVNPVDDRIMGIPAFKDINLVTDPVHIVDFVTPPSVTATVLKSMDPARFGILWFQDGSWDEACIEMARARFATVVFNACIMVAVRTAAYQPR